jgi:hypothetical protein
VEVRLALDTNRYTDLCRGDASVVETVERADEVWLPFIVLGELRADFAVGSQGPKNEAVLRRFLMKSGVGVLYADEQTTHHYSATDNCASKALLSPPTICGSPPSSCSIRSSSAPATHISTLFLNSRACRESVGRVAHSSPPLALSGAVHAQNFSTIEPCQANSYLISLTHSH